MSGRPEAAPFPSLTTLVETMATPTTAAARKARAAWSPPLSQSVTPETEIKNEVGTAAAIGESSDGTYPRRQQGVRVRTSQDRFVHP
jgi:hypothetical protein